MPVLPRDNGVSDGARAAIYILAAMAGLFCVSFLYYYAKESRYEQSEQRDFQWGRVLLSTAKVATLIGLFTWIYHQIEYNRQHPSRQPQHRLADTDATPSLCKAAVPLTPPAPAHLSHRNSNEKRGPRARGRSRTRSHGVEGPAASCRSNSSCTVTEPDASLEPVLGGSAESYYVEAQMALAQELHEITRQPEQPLSGGPICVVPSDSKQVVYQVAEEKSG